MNICNLLAKLASERPVFHSEKDFQHAFAWEVHLQMPEAKIRLEYRAILESARMYIDMWVALPDGTVMAIELKYKTRLLDVDVMGEQYMLRNQGAQDQGRYDFLKDVCRLERLTAAYPNIVGAAILLTNDRGYWTPSPGLSVDSAFRLHEGRSLCGKLVWGSAASSGTKRNRETPLSLSAPYNVSWTGYSSVDSHKAGEFRYLYLHVARGAVIQNA